MVKERSTGWYEGDFISIRQFRTVLMIKHLPADFKAEWLPYYRFLLACFRKWENHARSVLDLVRSNDEVDQFECRTEEDEKASDKDFLDPDTKVAKELKNVEIVEALKDLSWMDVILVNT